MPAYDAAFPVGSSVQVADVDGLRQFQATWSYHHSLREEHLRFAGRKSIVVNVCYYHGGDPLYELEGLPGLWHEVCLERA